MDDVLDPTEITHLLGISADKAHRKGDSHTSISKKGKIIHYSPFSTGMWIVNSCEGEYEVLECHIKSLLLTLYPLKDKLSKLSRKGYKMDMFCGAFINGTYQPGFEISADVLLQLGELNISLDMCVYP